MTSFALFPTPLGDCAIAWRDDTVVATRLPGASAVETRRQVVAVTAGTESAPPPPIQRVIDAMTALLAGERPDLSFVACDFSGIDPLAREVYAATRAIPAGETRTYGDIATQLGNRQLAQYVGRTLGRNPYPIIVPCHRVVGANGRLVGFSADGGVRTQQRMLVIEGAWREETPALFGALLGDPPTSPP
ncbi:MAG: methylated-DNA--[protein]-cysteine S-methyltransferase [Silanimonas sp.]